MRKAVVGLEQRGGLGAAPFALVTGLLYGAALSPAAAQDSAARPVYRCPGPPVLYTDSISPQEARERSCRILEGGAVTVIQAPAPVAPPATPALGGSARPDTRVDPAVQRARDTEARRILEAELRREEERLAEMRREFNNGEPERRGEERNYALYQQRVAEMRAAIERKQSDIAALRREIAKLSP